MLLPASTDNPTSTSTDNPTSTSTDNPTSTSTDNPTSTTSTIADSVADPPVTHPLSLS
jgi:hypothetical protein